MGDTDRLGTLLGHGDQATTDRQHPLGRREEWDLLLLPGGWSLPAPALVSASLEVTGDISLGDTALRGHQGWALPRFTHTSRTKGCPNVRPRWSPGPLNLCIPHPGRRRSTAT